MWWGGGGSSQGHLVSFFFLFNSHQKASLKRTSKCSVSNPDTRRLLKMFVGPWSSTCIRLAFGPIAPSDSAAYRLVLVEPVQSHPLTVNRPAKSQWNWIDHTGVRLQRDMGPKQSNLGGGGLLTSSPCLWCHLWFVCQVRTRPF